MFHLSPRDQSMALSFCCALSLLACSQTNEVKVEDDASLDSLVSARTDSLLDLELKALVDSLDSVQNLFLNAQDSLATLQDAQFASKAASLDRQVDSLLLLGYDSLAMTIQDSLMATTEFQNQPNYTLPTGKGILQGAIYDGITGDKIGGSSLQMYLVVASEYRKPDTLVLGENTPLVGEYVYKNLPTTSESSINNTLKMIVVRDGYHSFTSEFSYLFNSGSVESFVNRIGNVYLYPSSYQAQDVKIVTRCGNSVCPGATVYLEQLTSLDQNSASTGTTVATPSTGSSNGSGRDTRLYPTLGLHPSVSAITDTNGIATIPGSQLLLGAIYQAVVAPFTATNGDRFVKYKGGTFLAGVNAGSGTQSVVMERADLTAPAITVLSTDTSYGNGTLLLNMERPIVLADKGISATATSDVGTALTVKSINVTTTANGSQLRLQPIFSRTIDPLERITITYTTPTLTPLSYYVLGFENGNTPRLLFNLSFMKTFAFYPRS